MILLILLSACDPIPDTVTLTGTVFDGRDDDALPVAGATVSTRDAALEVVDEATADDDGQVSVEVGAGQAFFLVLDGEGFAPTAITGLAGIEDLDAAAGDLWMRTDEERAALVSDFAGCSDEAGAIVEGDVRFYLPVTDDTDTLPPVTTATVSAQYSDDTVVEACYLDDEGASDPEATETGLTARFAVFGLDSGPITVKVEAVLDDGLTDESYYIGWLPEDGVLPLYSALVVVD